MVSGRYSGPSSTASFTPGMAWRGLVTALCSYPVTATVIPGCTTERMAMFSPWVAFMVNTTRAGSPTPSNSAASLRQAKAVSSARRVASLPPRPGAAMVVTARPMARATASGFSSVVAALSR